MMSGCSSFDILLQGSIPGVLGHLTKHAIKSRGKTMDGFALTGLNRGWLLPIT